MAGRPIDEKLVVMKMDNQDFKKKAVETTSIFGKLKQTFSNIGDLRFGNKVVSEFSNIQKSANSVNMSSLASSVDTIAGRFSTLGVIATTALTNITNKAVNAGQAMLSSVTSAPVMSGFNEYETKMRSIGTMLSNTEWNGSTLDDVKKTLGELNEYADQTIYSFGQMTDNIGRFTAAGVTLEDSAIAIKGLGNLAAVSGSTTEQMNTAMYQMSQALAAGKLNLMDWNSMVNAGMGGKKTQDALVATAKAMGKTIDMSDGFRNSIQDGWLTSEVFLETLKKFGTDTSMTEAATAVRTFTGMMDALKESVGSGWSETWELIFGDFEQATVFWTALSNLIGGVFKKQTEARNNLIRGLLENGTLDKVGKVFENIGMPIINIFKAIGSAFKEAFPSDGGAVQGVTAVATGLEKITNTINLGEGSINNIKTIFQGLFSIISIGVEVVKAFASAFMNLIPGVGSIGAGILSLLAHVFKIPIAFNDAIKSGDALGDSTTFLGNTLSAISGIIAGVVSGFVYLGDAAAQAIGILSSGDYKSGPWGEGSVIVDWLKGVGSGFKSLFDTLNSIDLSQVGAGIIGFFTGVKDAIFSIDDVISNVIGWFKGLFETIGDNQGYILAGGGIAGIAAVLWKLWEVFSAVTKPLLGFGEVLENAGDALGAFTLGIHAKSLLTIAVAVGVLAVSFLALSKLDANQIGTGLYMIVGSLSAMVGALFLLSKYDITGSFSATMAIIGLSVAVGILAVSIKKLSDMNWGEMTQGIVGLVAILGTLTSAIVVISKFGGSVGASAIQILAIAGAIGLLVVVVNSLSDMDPGSIIKSVTTIGILLTQLGIFIAIATKNSAQFTASATGLLATAGAIWIIVQAMEEIVKIPTDKLLKGLGTVGVLLTGIAAFTLVTSDKSMMATGAAMVMMAGALTALLVPISILGTMKPETLGKGLGALAVALTALAVASKLMTGSVAGALAIGILAGALNLLIIPIAALGAMSFETLILGIGGLSVALLAIGGAAIVIGASAPILLAFGAAIALIGAGIGIVGIGMGAFAKGLIVLSTLTVGAVAAIVASIGAFLTGVTALIPAFVDLVTKTTLAVLDKLTEMTPKLIDSMYNLATAMIEKVQERFPEFAELGTEFIVMLIEGFSEHSSKVIDAVTELMINMIETMGENAIKFHDAATEAILKFLEGMQDNIPTIVNAMVDFVITLVEEMTTTVREKGPIFIDAWFELMGEVVKLMITAGLSVIDSLFGWIPGVTEATSKIGNTAYDYIDKNFNAKELGAGKGSDFAGAISESSTLAQTAGTAMAEAGVTGAKSVDAKPAGTWFGEGFISGMSGEGILGRVATAATNLGTRAYNAIKKALDINSPSEETKQLGNWTGEGFAEGISSSGKSVVNSLFGWLPGMDKATTKVATQTQAQGQVVGEKAVSGVSKGVTTGVKKNKAKTTATVKKAAKEVVKDLGKEIEDAFNKEMDEADYQYEMGSLNSEGYLKELERIKTAYFKHPQHVKTVNLEIKKIEEKAAKEREDLRKAEHDAFKNDLSDRKYYNELSLADELKAWEKIREQNKVGTEERKEADREVYRLKNEINGKLIELNQTYIDKIAASNKKLEDDIKSLRETYESELESLTSSYANATGLFDEITINDEVTGQQLQDNLQGQVALFRQWSDDMQILASRGIEQGLLEELRGMGPKAASEIHALVAMTDEELINYSNTWVTRSVLAREEATNELKGLKDDIESQIQDMTREHKKELDGYAKEWKRSIRSIKDGTLEEFVYVDENMRTVGRDAVKGLIAGLEDERGTLGSQAKSLATEITKAINNALDIHSPSRVTRESGRFVGDGLILGLKDRAKGVISGAKNMGDSLVDTFNQVVGGVEVPQDNEIHIKAVIEYDNTNLDDVKKGLSITPDLTNARTTLSSVKSPNRQNNDNVASKTAIQPQPNKEVKIEQNLTFTSKEMTPAEVARKNLQSSRELAALWGV